MPLSEYFFYRWSALISTALNLFFYFCLEYNYAQSELMPEWVTPHFYGSSGQYPGEISTHSTKQVCDFAQFLFVSDYKIKEINRK